MQLNRIIDELHLTVKTTEIPLSGEVSGGYASDLLSDVIANAEEGDIWVTLQVHQNIVAVAGMKDLAGVILVNSREPEEDTLKRANQEKIPLMMSDLPAFELIGRLYNLGLSGMRK